METKDILLLMLRKMENLWKYYNFMVMKILQYRFNENTDISNGRNATKLVLVREVRSFEQLNKIWSFNV